jgi:hypothetical protein
MPLSKVLQSIRSQIKEIMPSLDSFSDAGVQPAITECESLQKQLSELQESLSVYKFTLSDMDFSPSYKIHAVISEKTIETPATVNNYKEITTEPPVIERQQEMPVAPPVQSPPSPRVRQLVIGLNDKFRFINELFSQNTAEYNIAYQQLSTLTSWNESEIYLNSLKNLYGWKENSDVVKYFYSVVKKRFD